MKNIIPFRLSLLIRNSKGYIFVYTLMLMLVCSVILLPTLAHYNNQLQLINLSREQYDISNLLHISKFDFQNQLARGELDDSQVVLPYETGTVTIAYEETAPDEIKATFVVETVNQTNYQITQTVYGPSFFEP